MHDFVLDFNKRVEEIEKYFSFVRLISNLGEIDNIQNITNRSIFTDEYAILKDPSQQSFPIDLELQKILKGNCYLVLYNLIEGTIRSGLDGLFVAITESKVKYKDVVDIIKGIWLQYKYKTFRNDISNSDVVLTIEEIFDNTLIINFDDFVKKNKTTHGISGGIDTKKVNEIAQLYGFTPPSKNCESMLEIKNVRHQLAHGHKSFAEIGRIKSIEELIKVKNEVVQYLSEYLEIIINYIEIEGYKSSKK